MQREVVQDFLNLPGIEGVALVDGRSRPYFCGVDQTLNFQQKEALAQGIQQVVETTPPDFEFFEFQFTGHQVYIYKLDHGVILLVLTSDQLIYPAYVRAVEKLKLELQDDITNAIATFRLLAGNITLSGHDYWRRDSKAPRRTPTLSNTNPSADTSVQRTPKPAHRNGTRPAPPVTSPDRSASPSANGAATPKSPAPAASPKPLPSPSPSPAPLTLADAIHALNYVSQFTKQYLGATVVSNYWRSSRPSAEWLAHLEVDRSGQWTLTGLNPKTVLTSEQQSWIKQWMAAFSKRCSIVIRDFPILLQQSDLGDRLKGVLLPE